VIVRAARAFWQAIGKAAAGMGAARAAKHGQESASPSPGAAAIALRYGIAA
jgi:hypothetical protein